jgi:CHAT domain-containing protein
MRYLLIPLIAFCCSAYSQELLSDSKKEELNDLIIENRNKINLLFNDLNGNKDEIDKLMNINYNTSVALFGKGHIDTSLNLINYINFLYSIGSKKNAFILWESCGDSINKFTKLNVDNPNITDRERNIVMAYYNLGPELHKSVGDYKSALLGAETYLNLFDYNTAEPSVIGLFNISRIHDYAIGCNSVISYIDICNKYEGYIKKCETSDNISILNQLIILYNNLDKSHIATGDDEKGEIYFDKAYKLSKENNLSDTKFGLVASKADHHIRNFNKEKSDKFLLILEEEYKDKADDVSKVNYYYSNKAAYLENSGDIQEAIKIRLKIREFYSLIRDNTLNSPFRFSTIALGNAYLKAKEYEKALVEFDIAREIIYDNNISYYDFFNVPLFTNIAECYIKLNKPYRAIPLLRDSLFIVENNSKGTDNDHYYIFNINQKIAHSFGEYSEYEIAAREYLNNLKFYKEKKLNNNFKLLINLGEAVKFLSLSKNPLYEPKSDLLINILKNEIANYPVICTEYFILIINHAIENGQIEKANKNFNTLKSFKIKNEFQDLAIKFIQAKFYQEEGKYKLCRDLLLEIKEHNSYNVSTSIQAGTETTLIHFISSKQFGDNTANLFALRSYVLRSTINDIANKSSTGLRVFFNYLKLLDSLVIIQLVDGRLKPNLALNELQRAKGLLTAENIAQIKSNSKHKEENFNLATSEYTISKGIKEIDFTADDAGTKYVFLNQERMKNLKIRSDLDEKISNEYQRILKTLVDYEKIDIEEYLPQDALLIHMYEYKELTSLKPSKIRVWQDLTDNNNLKYLITVSYYDENKKLQHKTIKTIAKSNLDPAVNNLLNLFYKKTPNKVKVNNHINELSSELINPIVDILSSKNKIYISAIGAITDLPFGILKLKDNYLIESHKISYINNIKELMFENLDDNKLKDNYLVFSDPNFDSNSKIEKSDEFDISNSNLNENFYSSNFRSELSNSEFIELKYSAEEAKLIKNILGNQANIYTGDDADENYFYENINDIPASFVHFSTHAYYSREFDNADYKPFYIETGLALAGAKSLKKYKSIDERDGFYNGVEISTTNFENTKCVILNACSTESGDYFYSEGRMSLRKAFQIAGAKSVISTQWPVSDKIASLIMVDFVTNLKKGQNASDSLRNAQLNILQTKGYNNPFFWGGYLFNGNPNVKFL